MIRKAPKHGLYSGDISSLLTPLRGCKWPEPLDDVRIQESSIISDRILYEAFHGSKSTPHHVPSQNFSFPEDITSMSFGQISGQSMLEDVKYERIGDEITDLDAAAAAAASVTQFFDPVESFADETFGLEI